MACTYIIYCAQQSETSCIKPWVTHLSQLLCYTVANCLQTKCPTTRCHNALLVVITQFSKVLLHLGATTLPKRHNACHIAVASSPVHPFKLPPARGNLNTYGAILQVVPHHCIATLCRLSHARAAALAPFRQQPELPLHSDLCRLSHARAEVTTPFRDQSKVMVPPWYPTGTS